MRKYSKKYGHILEILCKRCYAIMKSVGREKQGSVCTYPIKSTLTPVSSNSA